MRRVPRYRYLTLAGTVLLAAGALTPAWAQADPDDVKRGVARISVIGGEVSVQRGDSGEWVAAVVNAPLLAGDQIAVGPDSRAEVQFDAAHALRLGGGSELRITDLQYGRYQLDLAAGTVTHRVLRPSDVDVELDTPNVSVRPSREGAYRITVNGDETTVTARAGDVEIFTPTGSQWLRNGQTMVARGASSDPEFQIVRATPRDEWDRWNDERDRITLASRSYQHVPQGVYGVEDLDGYGNWDYVSDYGYCWRPTVAVDWAPYSAGRWAWSDWYGWTWVSYDPWGWAPYHYGRWFYRERFGWYWYPGVMSVRHYWSPALVAFIGWGGGGIGFGLGNIGWVPLAPYDVFHPWWGRNYYGRPGYINRSVNIVNVNIVNVYRNARHRNAITGMRGDDFNGGRFGRYTRYSGNDLRDVRAVRGPMPVAPGRAHLNYSDRQVRNVPRTSQNEKFFRRQEPARVERISFSQQQNAFERAGMPVRGGRVAASAGRESGQGIGGNRGGRQTAAAGEPAQSQSGSWRRFGAPSGNDARNTRGEGQSRPERGVQQPETRNDAGQGASGRSSWRRFGVGGSNPAGNDRPGRTVEAGGPGPGARTGRTSEAGASNPGARVERPARPNEGGASERPASGGAAERPATTTPSRGNWQRFGAPEGGSQAPPNNMREAAPQSGGSWSRFGNPGVTRNEQRQQSAPPEVRNEAPRQAAPERRTERPSAPEPRSYTREMPSAAPSAPRNSGGGIFSAPRNSDGGGFSAPRGGSDRGGMSAPSRSVDRGSGGFSAPRSGGGGGGFSAPRSSGGGGFSVQRGGGGGGSAPRSAPSGDRGGGGNRGPRGR